MHTRKESQRPTRSSMKAFITASLLFLASDRVSTNAPRITPNDIAYTLAILELGMDLQGDFDSPANATLIRYHQQLDLLNEQEFDDDDYYIWRVDNVLKIRRDVRGHGRSQSMVHVQWLNGEKH
jgi:hypothetical protein